MDIKVIALNKKAYHDYFVEDKFETGIVLVGSEVKSLRRGEINMRDSYADIVKGEVILRGVHIKPYEKGSYFNVEAVRDRKLLLHKSQISRLIGKVKEKGYSLVPLQFYFKEGLVKVELGLCKGKHTYDKRNALQEKDIKRQTDRQIREYNK